MVWYDGMVWGYSMKIHTIPHTIPSYHTNFFINPSTFTETIKQVFKYFEKIVSIIMEKRYATINFYSVLQSLNKILVT